MDTTLLRDRLLDELRSTTYAMTAEYALRDFGTALTPVLDDAIAAGEVEVVEVRTDTSRFPGTPIRFLRAAPYDTEEAQRQHLAVACTIARQVHKHADLTPAQRGAIATLIAWAEGPAVEPPF